MLNWFRKDKIIKTDVIQLSPVRLSSVKIHPDGGISFVVSRGDRKETVRMYSGDIFELHREISVNLVER